jgi:hypothetical protein
MATHVRDLLTDALLELGVFDPSEAIDAGAANSALRELNRMLSSWANDDLMIYTVDRRTFAMVANQQDYTIGVGGIFNTPYPVRPGQINLVSVILNGVELPVEIYNDEQWRDLALKGPYQTVPSTIPLYMWADGNYPLDGLHFYPVPTGPIPLIMSVWGQITAFASVNDTVTLPQGYEDAIVKNLSIRLGPRYGVQSSPATASLAQTAKMHIKSQNWEPTYRTVDPVLAGASSSIGRRSRGYVVDP